MFFQARHHLHQNEMTDVGGGALRKGRQGGKGCGLGVARNASMVTIQDQQCAPIFGKIRSQGQWRGRVMFTTPAVNQKPAAGKGFTCRSKKLSAR